MNAELIVLLVVVVTALGFDFTNGFHDTGNAMATSIATGAPQAQGWQVALSASLNLVGAFLSVEVAATVAKGVVNLGNVGGQALLTIVFAGLVGGIIWNLATWLLGIPSSSSHALFGGLIGAAIASLGMSGVAWSGVLSKVVIPAVLAPVVAGLVARGRHLAHLPHHLQRRRGNQGQRFPTRPDRFGFTRFPRPRHQRRSEDHGRHLPSPWSPTDPSPPTRTCRSGSSSPARSRSLPEPTSAVGRVIPARSARGLVEIAAPQGMAAEASSAAIILTSSHLGPSPLHHPCGDGFHHGNRSGTQGRRSSLGCVAGRMAVAWLITLPSAAIVGALCWGLANIVGGLPGVLVVFAVLIALAGWMYLRSRKEPIDPSNVNAEWDGGLVPAEVPGPDARVTTDVKA